MSLKEQARLRSTCSMPLTLTRISLILSVGTGQVIKGEWSLVTRRRLG